MRFAALALAVGVSFGVTSAGVLPLTADRIVPVAAAEEPGAPASLDPLVDLVLERLNTADAVAAAKWATATRTGQPPVVDDPAREAEVYDSMAAAGARLGVPQEWVRQVFYGQIDGNKIVQRGLQARWRIDPAATPAETPDLATVRPVIDRVNGEILRQLADRRADLSGPACAQRVAAAVFPVSTSGRVDPLHAAALVRAAAALCPAPV
ncbi:chorismate mutase [Nocardia transvalensis]|uniref:chorismate mutase n=1 Tax=Nocardia transvalensis TaxID=37333 RepID=A0A7W9PCS2_9NOCA|nr:gamma subclass chorismate mutase AroQ [Nocardia transvalensis]MBB5913734.1 chorismate mutase [Nocardia transvalensis]